MAGVHANGPKSNVPRRPRLLVFPVPLSVLHGFSFREVSSVRISFVSKRQILLNVG
jgi:hypothetical protein